LRSRTLAAMVSLSAQSLTTSCSCPQNSSSMPCGLVILHMRNDDKENCTTACRHKVFRQKCTNSKHYLTLISKIHVELATEF
jgi:hypothetical protein